MSRKTKRLRHKTKRLQHKTKRQHNRKKNRTKTFKRKKKEIFNIPGDKGIPIFTSPDKKYLQKIMVKSFDPSANQSGNMIMGLRNMGLRNM